MGRKRIPEQKKLSAAIQVLHHVSGSGSDVIKGTQLKQTEREILLKNGFLQEIIKGWYFVTEPSALPADEAPYLVHYWEYVSCYLGKRFGDHYCLNPEHSLLMHAQSNRIPRQINVMTRQRATQKIELSDGHALLIYPTNTLPDPSLRQTLLGIQCLAAPACLVLLAPRFFRTHASDIQIVMSKISDPADIADLVEYNALGVGRLIGAYRQTSRLTFADDILKQLEGSFIKVPVVDSPFDQQPNCQLSTNNQQSLYARVKLLWYKHRDSVLACKPQITTLKGAQERYLEALETLRADDAYHGLTIERYQVTPALIQDVADGLWSPDPSKSTRHNDTMAAITGYLRVFNLVKKDIEQVYAYERATADLFIDHEQSWFRQLCAPFVDAGLLTPEELNDYRRHRVILRGSKHSPPHVDQIASGMTALKECLSEEVDPFVRATLGHWLLSYIQPYANGTGWLARFTMNLMLAEGGYPWTIIQSSERDAYLQALELACTQDKLEPFARFLANQIEHATQINEHHTAKSVIYVE